MICIYLFQLLNKIVPQKIIIVMAVIAIIVDDITVDITRIYPVVYW